MFGRSPFSSDDGHERASEPLFRHSQTSPLGGRVQHASQAELAPGGRPRGATSVLSAAFTVTGEINGEADLQLDGHVKGDIRVTRLEIGPGARVEGAVRAQHVEVRGDVIGTIEAQTVVLHESARVEGDIKPGRLSMEGGAHFDGRVQPLSKLAKGDNGAFVTPSEAAGERAPEHAEPPRLRAVDIGAA